MKERPILMGAPMVRAILDGRKTQTRRIMRAPAPFVEADDGIDVLWVTGQLKCPYGVVGDRLWVREAFRVVGWDEGGDVTVAYLADGASSTVRADVDDFDVWVERQSSRMMKSGARMMQHDLDLNAVPADGWRDAVWIEMPDGIEVPATPSIHMPRWASRITLTITDVRVQRLQDITEDDATAEGVHRCGEMTKSRTDHAKGLHRCSFADLFDSINGEDAWDANPWVWALTFKRE